MIKNDNPKTENIKGNFKSLIEDCIAYVIDNYKSDDKTRNYVLLKDYRVTYWGSGPHHNIEIRNRGVTLRWLVTIHDDSADLLVYKNVKSEIPNLRCILNTLEEDMCRLEYF